MTGLQVDLTDTKHDDMSFYSQFMLNRTHEGGPTNFSFWLGMGFQPELPSVSKFLHDDLGGMIKKFNMGH